MPQGVSGFACALFISLTSEAARCRGEDEAKRYSNYIEVLTNLGIKYVQLEEALGIPPTMKDLGERFVSHTKAIKDDDSEGVWMTFLTAVENANLLRDHGADVLQHMNGFLERFPSLSRNVYNFSRHVSDHDELSRLLLSFVKTGQNVTEDQLSCIAKSR